MNRDNELGKIKSIVTTEEEDFYIERFYRGLFGEHYDELHWQRTTVNSPIEAWFRLVSGLKAGYMLGYDSYVNDLSSRTIIQDIWENGPVSLSKKIDEIVSPLDEEFKRLTQERQEPFSSYSVAPNHWWYFREPIRYEGFSNFG